MSWPYKKKNRSLSSQLIIFIKISLYKQASAIPWIFLVGITCLPFIHVSWQIDPVLMPRLAWLNFCLLLIWAIGTWNNHFTFNFWKKPLGIALGAYVLTTGVSLIGAIHPAEGLTEVIRCLSLAQVVWLAYEVLTKEENRLIWLFRAVSAMALAMVVSGLMDYLDIFSQLAGRKSLYQIEGTLANKNLLASALFLCLPCLGGLWVLGKKVEKIAAIIVGSGAIFLIIVTQTRAVWLALLISAFVVGGYMMWRLLRHQPWRGDKRFGLKAVAALIVIILLGIATNELYIKQLGDQNAFFARITSLFEYQSVKNEHTETIRERLTIWHRTAHMIHENNLLTGVGAGHWRLYFPAQGLEGLRADQGEVNFQRPHNDYLWVLSETGILGLMAYLAVLFLGLREAFFLIRELDKKKKQLGLLILAGLLGFMIISFFDFPKERPLHLVLLAVLIAIPTAIRLSPSPTSPAPSKRFLPLTFFLLTLLSLWVLAIRMHAESLTIKGLIARSNGAHQATIDQLESAKTPLYQLDPMATPLAWYQGEAAYLDRQVTLAENFFIEALAVHPWHIHALNNLGACQFVQGRIDSAKSLFQRALSISPHFAESNLNMVGVYSRINLDTALTYFLNCPPSHPTERYHLALQKMMGNLILQLERQVDEPEMRRMLLEIRAKPDWLAKIHGDITEFGEPPYVRILKDALYQLEMTDRVYDLAKADSIREKYGLGGK